MSLATGGRGFTGADGVPGAAGHDSVVLSKSLLAAAAAGGADARQMAREARIPGWALTAGQGMISSRYSMRLWELMEWALEDGEVPLTIAARHPAGTLDLFDYLFTTAATLREGLQARSEFMHVLTTNSRLGIETETDQEITYSYRHVEPSGRGEELCLQFAVAIFCAGAQAATGRPVVPAHITLAQPAPRSHRAFAETYGTRQIDFDAPVTTFTFRTADLDLPMRGADSPLNLILRRYAASLPSPPPGTWHGYFRQELVKAMEQGSVSLEFLARRMAMSPRTLQRRLAEHDTSWRAELDRERQQRAAQVRASAKPTMASLARQLGYSDTRAARRALRRLDRTAAPAPPAPGRVTGRGVPLSD